MITRKPPPTKEAIERALARAKSGNGRQLALIVKSFSTDDLARAFSNIAPRADLHGLSCVLSFAAGMKEMRAEMASERKLVRAGAQRVGD